MSIEPSSSWFEELPLDCPPDDAKEPKGEVYFRLVKSYPPKVEDFCSIRKLNPDKVFRTNECIARSLSIHSTEQACRNIQKFPTFRDALVVKLTLDEGSGVIVRTGKERTHFSWWMCSTFDPLAASELA